MVYVEALRASSQSSIWRPDTIGTPRLWAMATMASDSARAWSDVLSVCSLAVITV